MNASPWGVYDMDPRHAILLAVGEEKSGELRGRTLLQKKLYFASILADENFGFRPHYYGPYSRQVADAVDTLVNNGFLRERIDVFAGEPNLFGEWRRHSYELTDDGRRLLEAVTVEEDAARWKTALEKINSHQFTEDFNLLSIAAKVATILHEAGLASIEEIKLKAEEYGWELSPQEIDRVGEFLEYLGLVERQ